MEKKEPKPTRVLFYFSPKAQKWLETALIPQKSCVFVHCCCYSILVGFFVHFVLVCFSLNIIAHSQHISSGVHVGTLSRLIMFICPDICPSLTYVLAATKLQKLSFMLYLPVLVCVIRGMIISAVSLSLMPQKKSFIVLFRF